ncbi:hypothetical protein C9446_05420 [Providencia heimbachae]|uniref:hypothetical protein n=1 Tax=Providencia heimbachae TaxID=333962 RepID=UPI0010BE58E1|nr:hypothetical protein [Providencia heimbachae]QCJ69354.1 hypothetical protein C9446_05420 [Providencia heimbachae]
MKISKSYLYLLFLFVGVFSANTMGDNTKKSTTSDKIEEFKQKQSNDFNELKEKIIENENKGLPLLIDGHTMVTRVSQDDDYIVMTYEIKGIPIEVFKSDIAVGNAKKILTANYCQDESNMNLWRAVFSSGIRHLYYIDGNEAMKVEIKPSACNQGVKKVIAG